MTLSIHFVKCSDLIFFSPDVNLKRADFVYLFCFRSHFSRRENKVIRSIYRESEDRMAGNSFPPLCVFPQFAQSFRKYFYRFRGKRKKTVSSCQIIYTVHLIRNKFLRATFFFFSHLILILHR